MALTVGNVMTITVTVATIAFLAWFTRRMQEHRVPLRQIPREFFANHYYVHAAVFPLMAALKLFVDRFNDPVKGLRGDFTHIVHAIEGNVVLYIQHFFESPALTAFLNFHYLFIYALLFVLTPVYFMYVRERELADKAMLNYVVIYALAVPYYLFFNVDVTSTFLPGMKALLYHHSALYFDFFATSDPLDNAFPSLHMAIPFGLLFIHLLHCRRQGIPMRTWTHWPLQRFIAANTAVFMFSILYLGIHWITDILAGIALAAIGALAVHAIHPYLRPRQESEADTHRMKGVNFGRFAAVFVALLVAAAVFSPPPSSTEIHPNMQLGPEDVKADIIGPVPPEGAIEVLVTHIGGNSSLEAMLLDLDNVPNRTADGRINWTSLAEQNAVGTLPPNATLSFTADREEAVYVLLVHDPRILPENATLEQLTEIPPAIAQVRSVYPDARIVESLLLSIPSFILTAGVVNRQVHLRRAGLDWTSDQRLG